MKRYLLFVVVALLALAVPVRAQDSSSPQSPADLAAKVSQYVLGQAPAGSFNTMVVIVGNCVYELAASENNAGSRSLQIAQYLTTRDLDFPDPAHMIASQFIQGRFEIFIERYFYDPGMDGHADRFQVFSKEHHGIYEGFTREERDHRKKFGVTEEVYDGGRVRVNKGLFFWKKNWRNATAQERAYVQKEYEKELNILVKHLGL